MSPSLLVGGMKCRGIKRLGLTAAGRSVAGRKVVEPKEYCIEQTHFAP